jgi:hypothetical protein
MKAARLPALNAGCLYPQKILLILILVRGWFDPWAIVHPEAITSMKNRIRDFPACSAVPQSNALPYSPNDRKVHTFLTFVRFSLGLSNSRVLIIFRVISVKRVGFRMSSGEEVHTSLWQLVRPNFIKRKFVNQWLTVRRAEGTAPSFLPLNIRQSQLFRFASRPTWTHNNNNNNNNRLKCPGCEAHLYLRLRLWVNGTIPPRQHRP